MSVAKRRFMIILSTAFYVRFFQLHYSVLNVTSKNLDSSMGELSDGEFC